MDTELKFSKQSLIDTEAKIGRKHYAWIAKKPYGYFVTVRGLFKDTVFAAGSMKEAKDFVRTCAEIDLA
jgi:hypothetical protein